MWTSHSSICNTQSPKQGSIINVSIKRHGGEQRAGKGPMWWLWGCREPSTQTPSAPAGYQEPFERGPVGLQKTNRLPLIEFFKLPKIAASILSSKITGLALFPTLTPQWLRAPEENYANNNINRAEGSWGRRHLPQFGWLQGGCEWHIFSPVASEATWFCFLEDDSQEEEKWNDLCSILKTLHIKS